MFLCIQIAHPSRREVTVTFDNGDTGVRRRITELALCQRCPGFHVVFVDAVRTGFGGYKRQTFHPKLHYNQLQMKPSHIDAG